MTGESEGFGGEVLHDEEQYEECDVCGEPVDLHRARYYKSTNDMVFRHGLCHENGEAPEGYVFELTDTGKCCTNRQYNCGHLIFAPQTEQPMVCPECNDLEYDDGVWSVADDGQEAAA